LHQIKSEIINFAAGYFKDGTILARNLADLSSRTNLKVALGRTVEKFDLSAKKIYANGEEYKAKTILLATGNRLKRLDIPGASTFSEDILYKSYETPETFTKMRVAVVGGGDNAAIKALELATAAEQVYLIHRSDSWKARPDLVREIKSNNRIEVFEHTEVDTISGSSRSINSLHLTSKQTKRVRNITVDKLFVKIGYAPNTEPFKDQVECDKEGYVIVNNALATSVPSVYAAGDVISGGMPRIASAMGTGVIAARGIIATLAAVPAAVES
jgi:thioredoxin reductase (NADPH)